MPHNITENNAGFSTHVQLWLESDQGRVDLAQVGADFVIATEPCYVPANSTVWVVVSINGNERKLPYLLQDGFSASNRRSKTMVCTPDGLPF